MQPAQFEFGRNGEELAVTGDWTSVGMGRAADRLERAMQKGVARRVNVSGLGRIDTAGAYAILHATGLDASSLSGERDDVARLMQLVQAAVPKRPPPIRRPNTIYSLLARAGEGVVKVFLDLYATSAFVGRLALSIGHLFVNPGRFRWAAAVAQMERAGLDALPIVAVTNFFVGATIAFLGATLLTQFGASAFSVELVGIAVLREFGVLVTGIILAGRSASSFAAELGAMKMNQEVDAMETMGVDSFDALVIPRFTAMLTMMPLLSFIAMVAGLAGGVMVVWTVLNLSPAFFFQRLLDNVGPKQFWVGIVKAPVMAIVIAAIGCRQGLEVGGDVEQLGRRVTTAVVQSLFAIIVLDAIFALIFMQLNV
ncbi:ABC transporter permease [soil metagenome]